MKYTGLNKQQLFNKLNKYTVEKGNDELNTSDTQSSMATTSTVGGSDMVASVACGVGSEYEDDELNDVPFDLNFNQGYQSEEEIDSIPSNNSNKRKRLVPIYTFVDEYENELEALKAVDRESLWAPERNRATTEGCKRFYMCKYDHIPCKSKIYLLRDQYSEKVSIWANQIEHDHSEPKKQHGINAVTKKQIDILFQGRCKTATKIKHALRDKVNPFKPKVLDTDPDVENELYIPGLEIPEVTQINNYLQGTLKRKLHGKSNFTYADLYKWVLGHCTVPDNENEPFVIKYEIRIDDKVPEASILRVCLSSKALLKIAMKTKHICADATYQLMWQGIIYSN